MPDADMPTDVNGNRADMVIYGMSTLKRMNIGRLNEQFLNATGRDLTQRLRREHGFPIRGELTYHQLELAKSNGQLVEQQWDTLMRYFSLCSPRQVKMLENHPDHAGFVADILQNGIYRYLPTDNPVNNLDMAEALINSEFSPCYGPVTYRNARGELVTTTRPVLIGSLYTMMLEKTGEDWSSLASGKANHFGVPAKLNNHDKFSTLGRQTPVRGLGESETRSYVSYVGPQPTVELLDQSNNPEAHAAVTESLLRAERPSNIAVAVDRKKVPFGGSRPVAFVTHFLNCRGIKFDYTPDNTQRGITVERS